MKITIKTNACCAAASVTLKKNGGCYGQMQTGLAIFVSIAKVPV